MSLILSPRPQVLQRLASERQGTTREAQPRRRADTAHDDDHCGTSSTSPDDDAVDDNAEGGDKATGATKARPNERLPPTKQSPEIPCRSTCGGNDVQHDGNHRTELRPSRVVGDRLPHGRVAVLHRRRRDSARGWGGELRRSPSVFRRCKISRASEFTNGARGRPWRFLHRPRDHATNPAPRTTPSGSAETRRQGASSFAATIAAVTLPDHGRREK